MFTVSDIINLFVEENILKVDIYDTEKDEVVFSGLACDLPENLASCTIDSIDNPEKDDKITFNVTVE